MKAAMRIALVGCGSICDVHIKAILTNGAELVALCDPNLNRAKEKKEKYELTDTVLYSDYSTMLADIRPDVVHICTPHYLHAPMCVGALEQNIHVLCEKPLCISEEQMQDLRTAMKHSKAQLGVCHQNRYEPNMQHLKRIAKNGVRGGVGIVAWQRDAAYYNSAEWRGTWSEEGGGVMINQALHTLDLLQWICGMPDRVVAHISTDHLCEVMSTEDTAVARFECPDGTALNFYGTVAATANFPALVRVRLNNGDYTEAENELLAVDHKLLPEAERDRTVGKTEWGSGHGRLINDFYRCIRTGEHFAIDCEEGLKVVRMILAMYRSNGKPCNI